MVLWEYPGFQTGKRAARGQGNVLVVLVDDPGVVLCFLGDDVAEDATILVL